VTACHLSDICARARAVLLPRNGVGQFCHGVGAGRSSPSSPPTSDVDPRLRRCARLAGALTFLFGRDRWHRRDASTPCPLRPCCQNSQTAWIREKTPAEVLDTLHGHRRARVRSRRDDGALKPDGVHMDREHRHRPLAVRAFSQVWHARCPDVLRWPIVGLCPPGHASR
jgi:hypothetical protein